MNKFIVLTAVAALMIATLVTASNQAYAETIIIVGSDVGQLNSGDTEASSEGDGPSTSNGGTVGAGDLSVN